MSVLGDNHVVDGLLARLRDGRDFCWTDALFKMSVVGSLSVSPRGGRIMHFREEPVTPVYRHWMCEQVGCNGELLSTGESITRLSTSWKHRCGRCGHEDWADATYPRVAYLPIDAIGPDDSYT
jgi:hypothetical protein